jgi:hypothetical protein
MAITQTEKTLHKKALTEMFHRRYPGARMTWVKPLKQTAPDLLEGRIAASGDGWRARELAMIVYLPRSWKEGVGYRIA